MKRRRLAGKKGREKDFFKLRQKFDEELLAERTCPVEIKLIVLRVVFFAQITALIQKNLFRVLFSS